MMLLMALQATMQSIPLFLVVVGELAMMMLLMVMMRLPMRMVISTMW